MTRPPHRHRLDSHLARFALYCGLALYIMMMIVGASRLDLTATEPTDATSEESPDLTLVAFKVARSWDCWPGNPRVLEGPYRHSPRHPYLVDVQRFDGVYTLQCPPVSWLPR